MTDNLSSAIPTAKAKRRATMTRPFRGSGSRAAVDSLLYTIYATTTAEARWVDALGMLCNWVGARSAALGSHHFSSGKGKILFLSPEDPQLRTALVEHGSRNPWFVASADYFPGSAMTGEELLSSRNLMRTDFYRDLLKPYGLFHRLCGVAGRRDDLVYYVALHRGEDEPSFCEREKSHLKSVLSHLSLALENRWSQLHASGLANAMMGVLDRHAHTTFLADAEGRILYRNRTATQLVEQSTGFRLDGDRLTGVTSVDGGVLREAIREVAQAAAEGVTEVSRVLTLSEPGGQYPTVASVRSAGKIFLAEAGEFRELVLVSARNPHSEHGHHNCSFARRFELSPAQARVSALILTGLSLSGTARTLHVSENTVRSHLKQIFLKTNTHGQMELVHLHTRSCIEADWRTGGTSERHRSVASSVTHKSS